MQTALVTVTRIWPTKFTLLVNALYMIVCTNLKDKALYNILHCGSVLNVPQASFCIESRVCRRLRLDMIGTPE
jgi:hypothetical protein